MPPVIAAVASTLVTVGITTAATLGFSVTAMTIGTAMAIGAATIVAGGILANKLIKSLYEMPQVDTDAARQRTVKSTIEPQKIIYGEALVSGPISFVGVYGSNNRVLAHAVALAGHEVNDITDIHFDNLVISDSSIDGNGFVTSGVLGPTGGNNFTEGGISFGLNICKIDKHLGAPGQTADASLNSAFTSITDDHKGTGIAYISTHWLLKDASQEVWDKYAPQNIMALVQGKKVYDPRQDSTSPYYDASVGVGTQRSNDSSTWTYSTNPVWCLIDYMTDTYYGMSISLSRFDLATAATAANHCDQIVSGAYAPPSGSQKRFTCNGILFATDSHKTNINKILSSMNGMISYTNGQFVIRAGAYEAPSVSLNEDNLAGAVSVKTSVERSDRFNTVTGTFIDPTQNHKATEFPEVYTTAARNRDNGEILTKNIQLPMTNDRYMAQRIANKLIQQSDQQKVVTFPTNLSGMQIAVGDRVSVSLDEFNWSNKVFICLGWTLSDSGNGGINLILREDDSASYADPATAEYSEITATGEIVEGFRGIPDPQNLSATGGLKSIELNWTNPDNMDGILFVEVFASPNSSWANRVKIGETNGTQFFHDASNSDDPVAIGDTRYYWVRARAMSVGESAVAVSDRNPDNDTSTITATVGALPWADVEGDDKPEDNATVGATVGTNLVDDDGTTVLTHDDIINAVLRIDLANVQIETGEVLDLETGQDVLIQNLGDVAIYVNESNQIINASISSVRDTVTGLENTLVDLVSGVSDVYVQATPPVAGVGGIPDPIPTFSRWYDSDDSNAPYYWNDTEWVSLADPRIASNASSINTLQAGLNTANADISANASAIDAVEALVIANGDDISAISARTDILEADLETAEGEISANTSLIETAQTSILTNAGNISAQGVRITELEGTVNDETSGVSATYAITQALNGQIETIDGLVTANADDISALELTVNDADTGVVATANALSGITARVSSAEDAIDTNISDISALQVTVNDPDVGVAANASAISSLDARVTVNEDNISLSASDTTALQVSFTDLTKIQGEADAVITTEDGTELVLNLPTDVAQATSAANTLLDARVTSAEGAIVSQSTQISQLQSDLDTVDGEQQGTASALESLTTRVTDTEDNLSVEAAKIVQLRADLDAEVLEQAGTAEALEGLTAEVSVIDDEVVANAASISQLRTDVDGNTASITAINNVSSDSTSAIAQAVAALEVDVSDNQASITSINTVAADSDSAIAQYVFNLNATVSNNTADIADAIDSVATAQATADGKVTTFYQDEPPTAEGSGDLWVDTNDGNKLYRWDTSLETPAWVEIRDAGIAQAIQDAADAQSTADGKIVSFYQDEPPTAGTIGDLWFDTNDKNKLYFWNGAEWVSARDADIAQALDDAATADAKADGKVTTFYQDDEPTAEAEGDLWVDTNDGNKLYRANLTTETYLIRPPLYDDDGVTIIVPAEYGTRDVLVWVEIRDTGIATALSDASAAQATADGKIVSFYQDEPPATASEGDLWFDTNDGNKAYRWDSTLETPAWVTIQDNAIVQAAADITAINTVSVESDSAIAQTVAGLSATVGDNSAAITEINNVSATSDSAIAQSVAGLTVTVGDNTTTLNEVKTVTDGVKAQYTVTIDDENGHISGFGLVTDIIDGEATSAFIVNADQFAIGGAGVITDEYPFVVYTENTSVTKGGTSYTIPAGVYIADAFIQTAAIDSAQIREAAITTAKIDDLAVGTIKIANGAVTNKQAAFTSATTTIGTGSSYVKIQEIVDFDTTGGTLSLITTFGIDDIGLITFEVRRTDENNNTTVVRSFVDGANIFYFGPGYSYYEGQVTYALTDQPAAGTYTYSLWALQSSGISYIVNDVFMQLVENKK